MRILVTGGAGFIGYHLVDELIQKGHDVTILDNFCASKKENVHKEAKLVIGDVRKEDDVMEAVKGCDIVYHLAALIDLRTTSKEENYNTNYLGAKIVFDAATKVGAKIIFTSSAAVYGDREIPVTEEMSLTPLSSYAKNKLRAEQLLDKSAFITRFFNVYGLNSKSFVSKLCKNVKNEEEIPIYGDGLQTRDYIYVADVISALLLGIDHSGVFNVGTGIETSVMDLIKIVERVSGKKVKIVYKPANFCEIKRSVTSIKKIKSLLSWRPKISIEQGIKRCLDSNSYTMLYTNSINSFLNFL